MNPMSKPEHIMHAIAAEITRHEEELERLKVARDVLNGILKDASPLKDLSVKPGPMFTVVKTKTVSKPRPTTKRGAVRVEIAKMAFRQDTVETRQITKEVYGDAPTMPQQKSVWNALTAMVKNGDLVRIGVGIYSKPKPVVEQSA